MSAADQPGPDGVVRWPNGVSLDNVFTTPYAVPIGASLEAYAKARKRTTRTRERLQREGRDGSTIHGLSKRADVAIRNQRELEKCQKLPAASASM